jgi:hypothetical protein
MARQGGDLLPFTVDILSLCFHCSEEVAALGNELSNPPAVARTNRLRLWRASSGASRAYTPSLERTERSFGALRRGLRPLLAGLLRRLPQFSAFGRRYIQE